MARRLGFLVALGVVLAADIAADAVASRLGGSVALIGDALRLQPSTNDGIALGLLQGTGLLPALLAAVAIPALLVVGWRQSDPLLGVALGLVAGGAVANLGERLIRGSVLDYVDMGIGATRWPTYNVGDIGISLGIVLVLVVAGRKEASE